MKRKRTSSAAKRQYNMAHRLRLWGIQVETIHRRITLYTQEDYERMHRTPKRYLDRLRTEHGYSVQTRIPLPTEPPIETVKMDRVGDNSTHKKPKKSSQ